VAVVLPGRALPYSVAVHLNLNPAVLSSALSLMADAVRVMVAPSLMLAVAPRMVAVGALGLDSVVKVAWAAPPLPSSALMRMVV